MRKDGATLDALFSGTPLDPTGSSRALTFTVMDISEYMALEREIAYHAEELVRQTNSLAVANRKLNLMSSITRHDILNQLTILLGNSGLQRRPGPARTSRSILPGYRAQPTGYTVRSSSPGTTRISVSGRRSGSGSLMRSGTGGRFTGCRSRTKPEISSSMRIRCLRRSSPI
ncbi:hypothetical protein [Methanoculleus chikugoensis]|uniref:hypothetical protein n=1 Tax=Methanoculleus chikugoensis TaxID=118126 RepID=UPI001FB26F47|nr:hypothetical protein [Methanoculleus chikugoensis]